MKTKYYLIILMLITSFVIMPFVAYGIAKNSLEIRMVNDNEITEEVHTAPIQQDPAFIPGATGLVNVDKTEVTFYYDILAGTDPAGEHYIVEEIDVRDLDTGEIIAEDPVPIFNEETNSYTGEIQVTGLSPFTEYDLQLEAIVAEFGTITSETFTFDTLGNDIIRPSVIDLSVTNIRSTSVTINYNVSLGMDAAGNPFQIESIRLCDDCNALVLDSQYEDDFELGSDNNVMGEFNVTGLSPRRRFARYAILIRVRGRISAGVEAVFPIIRAVPTFLTNVSQELRALLWLVIIAVVGVAVNLVLLLIVIIYGIKLIKTKIFVNNKKLWS